MQKKSIVVADDSVLLTESLSEFFKDDDYFEIVAIANDGLDAVSKVEQFKPDYLLLDIVMPELDGFGVLSELKYTLAQKQTRVIVISQLAADGFINKALKYGANYFMAKPFKNSSLRERMLEFENLEEEEPFIQEVRSNPMVKKSTNHVLDERISNIFISVGIPAHIKGYQFLREAIKMAVDNPEIINSITKKLYPSIAEKFDTSPSKVERAIRHAIEVAWNRGKIENINAIFGIKVYSANEKPTNGEFIALVADKMLIEGA